MNHRRRGFVLAVLAVALSPRTGAASTKITMRGKLLGSADGNEFFTDPEGESESVTLRADSGIYLADYLRGCVGKTVVITVEPT